MARNTSIKYNDYPFWEVVKKVDHLASQGLYCYQKFTCDGCGNRLTIDEPNRFHREGKCDNCPAITNIEKKGCNYLMSTRPMMTGEDNAGTPHKN